MVYRNGRMGLSTKAIGKSIKLTALANCTMQMVISTKENGRTTKQMAKEPICMLMAPNIKVTG